jgi:hypothetical protein
VAALEGTRLIPGPPLALPPALEQDTSETGFVACLAATGDLLFADQGVALHVIRSDGTVGPTVPAATRGSCAWLGTDAVLFDVEETHHLGRWRPGHQDVALSDLQLTTPSVGRALVAALSDDDAPGRVVVVRTPTGPDSGRLDLQVVATLRPADGDAYQGLALSSDDAWLVAWGGLDGGATAWFDAYRWDGSAFSLAGRSALGPGEDVRTIGAGG